MEHLCLALIFTLFAGYGNPPSDKHPPSDPYIAVADPVSSAGPAQNPATTYSNSRFDYYGDPAACYDNYVTPVSEAEYRSVAGRYKQIDTDPTTQLLKKEGVYSIPLDNGEVKKLADCEEASDAMATYRFEAYLPSLKFYKFAYSGFEWDGIVYIAQENGEEFRFRDEPLFSPDKKQCVTVCLEQEGADRAGTIEVYRAAENGFDFLFGLWSDTQLPDSACWLDNNTLYLKMQPAESDAAAFRYYKITFDRIKDPAGTTQRPVSRPASDQADAACELRQKTPARTDTLPVKSEKVALIVVPADEEIKRLKRRYDSEKDFHILADDGAYGLYKAETYLEECGITIVVVDTAYRIINFDDRFYIDLADTAAIGNPLFDLLLYKRGNRPLVVPSTEIRFEATDYFDLPLFDILPEKQRTAGNKAVPVASSRTDSVTNKEFQESRPWYEADGGRVSACGNARGRVSGRGGRPKNRPYTGTQEYRPYTGFSESDRAGTGVRA